MHVSISTASTTDEMPRNTSGKACDACRRRKLKCSRTLHERAPPERCTRCIQTDLPCTFDDEHLKRGPKTGNRLRALRSAQKSSNRDSTSDERQSYTISNEATPTILSSNDEECLSFVPETAMYMPDAQAEIPMTSHYMNNEYRVPAQQDAMVDCFSGSNPEIYFNLEADGLLTDGFTYGQEAQQSWLKPENSFPLPKAKLLSEVSLFFRQGYVVYPILHYATVMREIDQEKHLCSPEFRSLVLSIVMFNEACKVRLSPQHDQRAIKYLARTVENLRTNSEDYHFADNPSLDALVVSLFLFIAYNVMDKHSRAFCYLTEAIGLFDLLGEISDPVDIVRQKRLRYVLYITESATVSIYGSQRKRMISDCPSIPPDLGSLLSWYDQETEDQNSIAGGVADTDMVNIDKHAVDLLIRMTRLHLATTASEVAKITVDDKLMNSMTRPQECDTSSAISYCDTQIADVAITRQWKLAGLWWNDISRQPTLNLSERLVNHTIETLAMTALNWGRTLKPGHLRIVGLGKVAQLADSICNISSKLGSVSSCTATIRHLIQTVAETDYDRYFAPQLSITEIRIGDIPRSFMFDDESLHYGDENEEVVV